MYDLVNFLSTATNTRFMRSLDQQFLDKLKEKISKDPSGPAVPPVAVLCTTMQHVGQFSQSLEGTTLPLHEQSCIESSQIIHSSATSWLRCMLGSQMMRPWDLHPTTTPMVIRSWNDALGLCKRQCLTLNIGFITNTLSSTLSYSQKQPTNI